MSILADLSSLPKLDRIADELTKIRFALESIAASLQRATELPAAPVPDHKIGPKDIGSYGLAAVAPEDADDIRQRFRAMGLDDREVEEKLVSLLAGDENEGTE
jgi:hypothetical protein